MASPPQWTWVWVDSRSWWPTGKPGVLWFTVSQRVGHDWVTELNWWLYMIPHAPKPTLWPHILLISPLFMPLKALIVSLLFFKHINYHVLPHSFKVLRVLRPNKPQRVVVVQSVCCVWLFATPWTLACQVPLSFIISQSLLKFMSIESVRLSNHLILCHPFSFCFQSFPASGSFSMSWLFPTGSQSITASVSALVLPMNIQGWFPLELRGLNSRNTNQKHPFFGLSLLYGPTLTSIHDYWKNYSFD